MNNKYINNSNYYLTNGIVSEKTVKYMNHFIVHIHYLLNMSFLFRLNHFISVRYLDLFFFDISYPIAYSVL